MKPYWFKAKRYGWGWYPNSWQGWLILGFYVLFEVWNFIRLDRFSHSASDTLRPFIIQTALATILLICICALTGERPRWMWGEKNGKTK